MSGLNFEKLTPEQIKRHGGGPQAEKRVQIIETKDGGFAAQIIISVFLNSRNDLGDDDNRWSRHLQTCEFGLDSALTNNFGTQPLTSGPARNRTCLPPEKVPSHSGLVIAQPWRAELEDPEFPRRFGKRVLVSAGFDDPHSLQEANLSSFAKQIPRLFSGDGICVNCWAMDVLFKPE